MANPQGFTVPLSNGGAVTFAPGPGTTIVITVSGKDLGIYPPNAYSVTAIISEADACATALESVIVNQGGP